jgi:D-serine deaminase-like pyridoxal phosphate-dependent protein
MIDLTRLHIHTTPTLVLVREALERNLDLMQGMCNAAGVGLRPHGKMHKCSTLAKLQMSKGAVGICAQTLGEAEAFAAGGVRDLLITSPLSLKDTRRVVTLANASRVACVVDDPLQVAALGAVAVAAGVVLDLLVDIDLGQHRTGVKPGEVERLAKLISATAGTRFAGIQGYVGHLQHVGAWAVRLIANAKATATLGEIVSRLRSVDLAPRVVTGGGTGTHASDLASGVFTEIQAGSYAVMDVEYANCDAPGGGQWPFSAALFVATSVVSAQHNTHLVIDAGLKALSTDGPVARVIAGAPAGSIWRAMGDEHGAVFLPWVVAAAAAVGQDPALWLSSRSIDVDPPALDGGPRLGDTVWLQPGHCDPTINLYDAFLVLERDGSWAHWPIDGRRAQPAIFERPE